MRNKWLLFIAGIPVLTLLVGFGFDSITRLPRGAMTDDSYYYAKIAYNIGIHGLSSFDGVNQTDGYHLLWVWLLATIVRAVSLVTDSLNVHLGAMLVLYFALCWFMAVRFASSLLFVVWFLLNGVMFKVMMETTLLALVLLYLLETEFLSHDTRVRWRSNVLLFLVPFVRIDGIVFVVPLLTLYLFEKGWQRRVAWAALALGLGTAVQFACRYALFGYVFSVSSTLKAGSVLAPFENLRRDLLGMYGSKLLSFAVFAAVLSLTLLLIRHARGKDRRRFAVVAAAATGFMVLHVAFNQAAGYWYYIPSLQLCVYLLDRLYPLATLPSRRLTELAMMLLLTAFVGKWAYDTVSSRDDIEYARDFVRRVKEVVPPGERLYQVDGSGYVGFFSERRVINGDGLVNSHQYAKALRQDQLGGYLERNAIRYVVTNRYPVDDRIVNDHGLVVTTKDVTPLIEPPPGRAPLAAFGLYRLKD